MRSTRRFSPRSSSRAPGYQRDDDREDPSVSLNDDEAGVIEVESESKTAELDQVCMDAAMRFLAQRPRSEQEIRRRLQIKGQDADRIDRILVRLRESRLANDHDFAQYWTENRSQFKPRGDRALRSELFQKGVARDVIDTTLDQERDVVDDAYRAGLRRAIQLASLDERAFRERLKMFLMRRGFDWETIEQALKRLRAESTTA